MHQHDIWKSNRPLLGTNGTEAMAVLLEEGQGELVDYLKVGPFMGQEAVARLARSYPLLLHLDDTLSSNALRSAKTVERLRAWIALTGTPWVSEHIGFGVADVTLDEALITQPTSSMLSRQEALERIVGNARYLAAHLPVPLLLENIPLFPNLAHWHVCEPDFIRQVLDETGCDLLLDLAHARVSANLLGYDVHDYIAALPLDRLVEIHLSGPRPARELDAHRRKRVEENARSVAHLLRFSEESLVDAHETLREEDYELLQWVLAQAKPRAISLEYFYAAKPLRQQLEQLNVLLKRDRELSFGMPTLGAGVDHAIMNEP